jgi:hypothetical protein
LANPFFVLTGVFQGDSNPAARDVKVQLNPFLDIKKQGIRAKKKDPLEKETPAAPNEF